MESYLCIGGPLDGKMMFTDDVIWTIDNDVDGKAVYEKCFIKGPGDTTHYVFLLSSVDVNTAIQMLFKKYSECCDLQGNLKRNEYRRRSAMLNVKTLEQSTLGISFSDCLKIFNETAAEVSEFQEFAKNNGVIILMSSEKPFEFDVGDKVVANFGGQFHKGRISRCQTDGDRVYCVKIDGPGVNDSIWFPVECIRPYVERND